MLSPDLAIFSLSSRTRSLDFAMVYHGFDQECSFQDLGELFGSEPVPCAGDPLGREIDLWRKSARLDNMNKNGIIDYR